MTTEMKASQNPKALELSDKITATCVDCGATFETYRLKLLEVDRLLSTRCPTCRKKKLEEEERLEREAIEKETKERKSNWRYTCGIPQRFMNESFKTFKDRGANTMKLHKLCIDYAEHFPLSRRSSYPSLGIFSNGVWGNGKTHLACSIAHRIIDRWLSPSSSSPVVYVTEPQMFRRIRATYNKGDKSETEEDVYERLTTVPLLIIDDIGKEEVSDPRFVQRAWFLVINGRYDNVLPVVITANLNPEQIANHLGGSRGNEAAFDRLYEMLNGVFWENEGTSFRRELKGKNNGFQ